MFNPFSENFNTGKTDEVLIAETLTGNRISLECLIRKHQNWIYNIALRMIFYPDDAKDVTQEVLIKIITKLSSFKGKSSFRTWAYRIVVNHVLNMKKSRGELQHSSRFSDYSEAIDRTADYNLPDPQGYSTDMNIIIAETKVSCMFGMLLCLDREQRLVYIFGSVLGVSDRIAGEILNISPAAYRKKLERARKDLHNFMNNKCGLVKKSNPCFCHKKTKALIDTGYVNPESLRFYSQKYYTIKEIAGKTLSDADSYLDKKCIKLFKEHPFMHLPESAELLKQIISSHEFKEIFFFN
jgi:RNA polymerase sigma factor (sigma-70 family)